jgi:hypothetical protein
MHLLPQSKSATRGPKAYRPRFTDFLRENMARRSAAPQDVAESAIVDCFEEFRNGDGRTSAQPARRDVRLTRILLGVRDLFLRLFDLVRDALQLGECLQTIVGDFRPLIRIVSVHNVS